MSGRKSAKQTQTILSLNWGAPAGGKTPSSDMARGVGHKSAVAAGVTRDHAFTPMAQRLAAELERDRIQDEKDADPRSRFEKRYNIVDGVANLSINDFLKYRAWSRPLRVQGIREINLGNGDGISAKFEFYDEEKAALYDQKDMRVIAPTKLGNSGTLAQLKAGDRILLYTHKISLGWLTIEATMQKDIAAKIAKVKSLADMNPDNNFADLFHSRAGLRQIVENGNGQQRICVTKQFTNAAQEQSETTVGFLAPIGSRDICELPIKAFRELWMVASASRFNNGDDVRRQVYKGARAVLVCADNDRSEPLAILTRRP